MDEVLKKSLAEYICGIRKELVLEGPPSLIAMVYEAATSSRELFESLETNNFEMVQKSILRKKRAVKRWESFTGVEWGL